MVGFCAAGMLAAVATTRITTKGGIPNRRSSRLIGILSQGNAQSAAESAHACLFEIYSLSPRDLLLRPFTSARRFFAVSRRSRAAVLGFVGLRVLGRSAAC
jgi:hypothetical protein